MNNEILDSKKIIATVEKLCLRIEDRFPHSSLFEVAKKLYDIAKETDETIKWIKTPNYGFRLLGISFILVVFLFLAFTIFNLELKLANFSIAELIQLIEAAVNDLVYVGIGVIFIVSLEIRSKRKRVITALNRLRSIAHVIDTHQLTKDPDSVTQIAHSTKHSPSRNLSPYELGRYLDYCSEMLALSSKVAFLYVQHFDDPVSVNAVNDYESLTTGLSRKIWQKIMILRSEQMASNEIPAANGVMPGIG